MAMRPYNRDLSRDANTPKVDTRIKRKDVKDAIEKLHQPRTTRAVQANPTIQTHVNAPGLMNQLLSLPGELRNLIYHYTLNISTPSQPTTRIPYALPSNENEHRNQGLGLLQANQQITAESRSLIEALDTAYIPVTGRIPYGQMIEQVLTTGPSSLPSIDSTLLAGLTSFMSVHIHLHTGFLPGNPSPRLDPASAFLYGRLRQVLIIFSAASAALSAKHDGKKRRAVIHLDHLFSDWRHMIGMRGCYKFKHIARLMGEDQHTEWELRYYVYTSDQAREEVYWPTWDEGLREELDVVVEICAPFENVSVRAEVYGEAEWSVEGERVEVTREITTSAKGLVNWPEDVPWRLEPPSFCAVAERGPLGLTGEDNNA